MIITPDGTQILTDPVEFKGYHLPKGIEPDIVTISHNHPDHNSIDAVGGNPLVLWGTDENLKKVYHLDTVIKDVRVISVPSYHSPGKFGYNAIFVFEFMGIRIAHLGDLGTVLTDEQVKAIGPVDMLMLPVGGQFTISGADADAVVDQLAVRKYVLPMHYKTEKCNSPPYTVNDYLKGKDNVLNIPGDHSILDVSFKTPGRQYVVFNHKDADNRKDISHGFKTIIDQRDNQSYKTIKISDQRWFAENLNYDIEGSYDPEIDSIGRLYNYEAAIQACPEGFHLPSDEEWLELEKFLGIPESQLYDELGDVNRGDVAHKIKMYQFSLEPENDLKYNTTGFSAIPAGYFVRGEHNHIHTTAFWTSTSKDLNSAYVRGLNPHTNGIGRTANNKEFGFSVRCIKD